MTTNQPSASAAVVRDRPPVVIAIAHWNRIDLLRQCLTSVKACTDGRHYRICVFDQGSTDGSVDYLRSLIPGIDVIFSPDNIGFTLATNAIIDRYPDSDVVLLNNDTCVTAGWLAALADTATRAGNIGIVGARLVLPDGRLQEAGGDVFADGRVRARGRFESASDPRYQEPQAVDYCSAACLYVKRAVFERCGALEPAYEAGYYEDVDLAFKARAAGFTVMYQPRCLVIHHEHGSFGAGVAGTLIARHRDIFRSRWASCLAAQPASPFELSHGHALPRLLLLTELVPANTLSPRMRRIRQLIRGLNGTFQIACMNALGRGLERYAAVIEELGAASFYPPMHGERGSMGLDEEELIRVNYFPLALCGSADAAAYLRNRFPPEMLDATTVAVDVGMDADVVAAAARTGATHFVVMNEAQRRQLLAAMPQARCAVLPPLAEITTSHRAERDTRTDIVMLSDNLDGPAAAAVVVEMMAEIVPALRRRQPDARVRLGGGPASRELLASAPDGLEILPASTAIGTVLDRARVVVVPRSWCRPDTISNVAEARGRAIPIVASSAVMAGTGLSNGVDGVAVDSPDAFVEQIVRLYNDPWWWNAVATGGRSPALPVADDLLRSLTTWAQGDAVVTSGR